MVKLYPDKSPAIMLKKLTVILLIFAQTSLASQLSDGALKLIQIGNEIASRDVILRGQSLLLKGAFDLGDLDAMYEASKQVRTGNKVMGYAPQQRQANEVLIKLVQRSYDPALYDYALYLLDGSNGIIKNEFLALEIFEESFNAHGNPHSGFAAALIRNESLVPGTKDANKINEMMAYAILNKVDGAQAYQDRYIRRGHLYDLEVDSYAEYFTNPTSAD